MALVMALVLNLTRKSRFGSRVSAVVVSPVVIVARFVWMYPATYLPRLAHSPTQAQGSVATLPMPVRAPNAYYAAEVQSVLSGRAHRHTGLFPGRAEAAVGGFRQNSGPVATGWMDGSIGGTTTFGGQADALSRQCYLWTGAHRLIDKRNAGQRQLEQLGGHRFIGNDPGALPATLIHRPAAHDARQTARPESVQN